MWGGISVATFHAVDVAYCCAKSNYFRRLNLANHVSHFECDIVCTTCNRWRVAREETVAAGRNGVRTSVRLINKNR